MAPIDMKEFGKGHEVTGKARASELQPLVQSILDDSSEALSQSEVAERMNEVLVDRQKPVSPNHARSILMRLIDNETVERVEVNTTGPREASTFYASVKNIKQ